MTFSVERHKEHVFYPWSRQNGLNPAEIVSAEGCYFTTAQGQRIFDFSAQLVCVNAGHGQKSIIEGIKAQLDSLTYVAPSFAAAPRTELAERLVKHTPGRLKKVLFTNGGADANENALKMARRLTGRWKVLTRYRSYHGGTYGAMSLSGDPRHFPSGPGIQGVIRALDPYCYRCPFGLQYPSCNTHCAEHVRQVIEMEGPETIAAILMEPITGTNGLIIPPPNYYKGIRELCDKYGILLIADEVMTGFGRTGTWFACEHYGLEPDILVCAKGITSAYIPLGAVVVREDHAKKLDDLVLDNGLTYAGHPIACAAGNATLQFYEENKTVERVAAMEPLWLRKLNELKDRHKCVGDVRGKGFFGCVEMVKDKATRQELVPFNAKGDAAAMQGKVVGWMREEGLYAFCRWSYIFLAPPLVATEAELDDAFARLSRVLGRVDAALG